MKLRVLIGYLNAVVVYIAWANLAFFALFFLTAFMIALFDSEILNGGDASFIGWNLGAIIVCGFLHLVLSFFVRCPQCSKCLTLQGLETPKNPGGKFIGGWAYEVFRWFTGKITCIHCGAKINTHTLEKSAET